MQAANATGQNALVEVLDSVCPPGLLAAVPYGMVYMCKAVAWYSPETWSPDATGPGMQHAVHINCKDVCSKLCLHGSLGAM